LVGRFEVDPEAATEWWKFRAYVSARTGDRVYVFKQEEPKGIFGVGTIISG
jgi:hypothetical protein